MAVKSSSYQAVSRAVALYEHGDFQSAERICSEIVAAEPDNHKAWTVLGVCAQRRGDHKLALRCLDRSLQSEPRAFQTHYNRGLALKALHRGEQALAAFNQAICLQPSFASAFCNRANVLRSMNRLDEAIADYDRAIELSPYLVEAHNNRGAAFQARGDFREALRCYDIAIEVSPDFRMARANRGLLLLSRHEPARALPDLDIAVQQDAVQPYLVGHWLQTKKDLCDWSGLDQSVERAFADIADGKRVATPFNLLALPLSRPQQAAATRAYVADRYPSGDDMNWRPAKHSTQRIKVAYVSPDFHDHATSYLLAEVIELHDRTRFEVVGISFGPTNEEVMRARMIRAFDSFHDVGEMSDCEITEFVRNSEIDIAVDLIGHAGYARTGILAPRAAPIQVNYLGYPGGMGADFIDYVIADEVVLPPEHRSNYTERVVYLPDTYQANDATKKMGETPTRADVGLPGTGFVFCCFNSPFKLSRDVFDIWMRLLSAMDGSVLWLREGGSEVSKNLRKEAEERGVRAERLVFARRQPLETHLARHGLADLFLDTFYYNAHTTASDALWAGLPVLTCLGDTFAGRVAASLLTAIGLPELITRTPQEYEAAALRLATDPAQLSRIRSTLSKNRSTHPLFDTPRFVRHLEGAYLTMWERYQNGLPPDHIEVEEIAARASDRVRPVR